MAKENFASKEGVMLIDDTGFPKSGNSEPDKESHIDNVE